MVEPPEIGIGAEIDPWGKVVGMHSKDGERSYFFESEDGVISLIPSELLNTEEKLWKEV